MRTLALACVFAFAGTTVALACPMAGKVASTKQQVIATETTETQTKVVTAPRG